MALLKHIKRLQYIDYLIKRKATGNLNTFAKKNSLCKSALSEVLQEMKELGFPIKYDRFKNTYYYAKRGEMVGHLFIEENTSLLRNEITEVGDIDNLCFSEINVFKVCNNS